MEDKLRLLAEKLVNDGLEEARLEKDKLLNAARMEAESIRSAAQQEADARREQLNRELDQMRSAVQNELAQLTRRAKDSLRADLRQLLTEDVLQKPVQYTLDKHWPDLLKTVVQQLYRDAHGRLQIQLPEAQAGALESNFNNALQAVVQKGIDWQTDPRLRSGFRISVEGERFAIDFTDEDFEKVLAPYYGAALKKMLADG